MSGESILKINGKQLKVKFGKPNVTFFASKKPRKISLIHNTLETSALSIWILLIFFPPMGPLVDALSCGIAPSSLTIQSSRIAMLCRLNFSVSSLEKTGFSLIFMLLVH